MLKTNLRKVWRISWRNPFLWLFGFFAAPLISLEVSFLVDALRQLKNVFDQWSGKMPLEIISLGWRIKNFLNLNSLFNIIIFLLLVLLIFILANLAQVAVIRAIKNFKEEQNEKVFFKKTLIHIDRNFWSVTFYNFLNLLIILSIFFLIFLFSKQFLAKFTEKNSLSFFYISIVFLISFLFVLFISLVTKFSIFYLLLEEEKLFTAIKKAYLFLLKNLLPALRLFITLILIGLVLGVCLFLFFFTASIPLFFLLSLFYFLKTSIGVIFIFILSLVIYLGLTFLISGLFSSFQIISWLFFFKNQIIPKIAQNYPVDKK